MLSIYEIKKINQIVNDCQQYINKNDKMPPNFNLTDKEYLIYLKARQEGIRLSVEYHGGKRPIPVSRGWNA